MNTQQLEKRFQIWNHVMYMVLGSCITLVAVSFGYFIHPIGWPSFTNYTSGLWLALQLIATSLGFYLLWSPRWKSLPLQTRINTITGYFIAAWFNLIAFGLMIQKGLPTELSVLIFCLALFVPLAYLGFWKKPWKLRDEMFP